jgi:four helix bundle protein
MESLPDGSSHRRLLAWKEAKSLAVLTYVICAKQKHRLDRGLIDQMRNAAISVQSNLAEGNGRGSNKDSLRFLYISRGSLCELESQVEVCLDAKLLPETDVQQLLGQAAVVARLIGGLIHYRKQKEVEVLKPEKPARPPLNP